jgi:hypothetical protein
METRMIRFPTPLAAVADGPAHTSTVVPDPSREVLAVLI